MHDQDIPAAPCLSPAEQDRMTESAVLAFVLDQHPDQLTDAELLLAFHGDGPQDFASTDATARALRELIGAGLLRRLGVVVAPTRAALYFSRLQSD